jgi:hypothetical protein
MRLGAGARVGRRPRGMRREPGDHRKGCPDRTDGRAAGSITREPGTWCAATPLVSVRVAAGPGRRDAGERPAILTRPVPWNVVGPIPSSPGLVGGWVLAGPGYQVRLHRRSVTGAVVGRNRVRDDRRGVASRHRQYFNRLRIRRTDRRRRRSGRGAQRLDGLCEIAPQDPRPPRWTFHAPRRRDGRPRELRPSLPVAPRRACRKHLAGPGIVQPRSNLCCMGV